MTARYPAQGSPSPEPSTSPTHDEGLAAARDLVRTRLESVALALQEDGIPAPSLDGKLLRPLTAYLIVPPQRRGDLDDRFWAGALALEMVHEASLLHDDILDDASERRGKPTMVAAAGVGPALVKGDHLLTGAYRAAAAVRSPVFLNLFIHAVERTVAGEIAQERNQGRVLSEFEYRETITKKSGELFRAAFSLAPQLLDMTAPEQIAEVGARLGCLYQMVDDFLDYCPAADRGKTPLQDYHQQKWTWPLGLLGVTGFDAPDQDVLDRLFSPGPGSGAAPMQQGVRTLEREAKSVLDHLEARGMETRHLERLLSGWVAQASAAAAVEVSLVTGAPSEPRPGSDPLLAMYDVSRAAMGLSKPRDRLAYFGHHAKTFRFAARLFPAEHLEKTAGVYAFCRFTDDLVDEAGPSPAAQVEARLDAWLALARRAYGGEETGIGVVDDVMADMRDHSVPFRYVEELVAGVRMDLHPKPVHDLADLRTYSFRVASVVGGWLTRLFGIHDPWVLDRAYSLGHAMQLTNILRDVGDDLRQGRLYLPQDLLHRHGLDRSSLHTMSLPGAPILPGYRSLLDELMAEAEAQYERAFQAIPFLPGFFQGPVAVAARVYEGIHTEIRANDYDNFRHRATTSKIRKLLLGARALWDLQVLKRTPASDAGATLSSHDPDAGDGTEEGVPA